MRKIPPLNSLKAFEAAARHMNFAAAADELGVTPTAISHQIRLLEETIGQTLFRRNPRPLSLTEIGERLFPTIRDSLDKLEQGILDVTKTRDIRTLKISTTVAFASNVLLGKLAEWSDYCPDIDLDVHASDYPVDLGADDIDIAVRYAKKPGRKMIWQELCSDAFYPMMHPDLLQKNHEYPIKPQDIPTYPLISYRWKKPHKAEPTWKKWREQAYQEGYQCDDLLMSQMIKLSEESHAMEAAISGQGVALASSVIAGSQCHLNKLMPISNIALPGLTYFLVYQPHLEKDNRVKVFQDWLTKILLQADVEFMKRF